MLNVIVKSPLRPELGLIERLKRIHPSELGHVIEYGFMDPDIRLLGTSPCYIVGPALTVRITPTDSVMVYKALDMARPGDVIVVDSQGERRHACWGEITSLNSLRKKLAGAVIDGPATDSGRITELGFPVFSRSTTNLTTKLIGFRGDINVPVQCGGVTVKPGDIVCANEDGVLVIPFERAESLIQIAEAAEKTEEVRQKRIAQGDSFMDIMGIQPFIDKMNVTEM
jgi:4-hydroxy-4-methyl-2-oxoglutarate aldolase